MSFPFGNRSSFRDRNVGKSSDEILDDMLKNIKQRKKEFFESPPKWRSMGMFDDELGSAGGSRFKDHLGDLAARHPELADHLLDLLPEENKTGKIPKAKGKTEEKKNTSHTSQNYKFKEANRPQTTTTGTQTGGLESDIKLRSTVPDMQSSGAESVDGDRGQRAQSAPPHTPLPNRPQQKEEGIRHIPIRTDSPSGMHPQMPRPPNQNFSKPSAPFTQAHPQFYHQPQQHYQQPQPQPFPEQSRQEEGGKQPTVRHIPIFVEGRDEPLLPKDLGPGVGTKRGGCQGKPDQPAPEKKQPPPEQQGHDQSGQQQHQTQNQQQTSQQQASPTPTPAPPVKPDPLVQVAEVVKEVEALAGKVNEWSGTSRTDKEYMYLDEMLTRNLLKLDNIETEGKDEVRTARKEAIRKIQAAISILESKSDSSQLQQANQEEKERETISPEDKKTGEENTQTQLSDTQETSSTHCATQT